MPRGASVAGYAYTVDDIPIHIIDTGTAAQEWMTDHVGGFARELVSATYVQGSTAGAGAAASRPVRVIKGASTVMASVSLLLASTNAGEGVLTALTMATALTDRRLGDADTLTIDVAASGTQFTTGPAGFLRLVWKSRPQQ